MDLLLNFLKSRFAVGGTFLIIFCIAVFYLGSYFEWSYLLQGFIVLIMLLILILIMVIQQARERKKSEQLEKSLKAQAEAQMFGAPADKKAELEELSKKFTTAVETLKASKLSQGQKGNAALYALPWYLIVGPPAAGKTTMVRNSGLDFPLDSGRIRGVGGTRDCDWFFSNSAIFLDTAGRYTTEESDSAEWLGFLDLLKKYRPKTPLNGVMVGISITDLMGKPEDVEFHAATIRKRLDELISRLGVHFPVYLVFTKCDLVQGCIEFFSDLNARETEQVWGYTLTTGEQNSREHAQIFRTAYKKILDTLENIRLTRLNALLKREDRRKIYSFPDEMAMLKDPLTTFVNRLFQNNPFQENPIFRGFYFTSGTQEGVPVDQVIQSIARQYNLPNYGANEFPEQRETKSYFIKDLFTRVLIHDQKMVRTTSKADKLRERARIAAAGLAALVLLLFVFGVGCGYRNAQQTLTNLQQGVNTAKTVNWERAGSFDANLSKLDELRQRIEEAESESGIGTLWMTRGSSAARQARSLLFLKFKPLTVEMYRNIQSDLNGYLQTGDDAKGIMEGELGAYILMGPDDRMATDFDPPSEREGVRYLQDQLLTIAHLSFIDPSRPTKLSEKSIQMAKALLKMNAETIRLNEALRFGTNKTLVLDVRRKLRSNLTARSLYNSMKLQIITTKPSLGSLNLSQLLGKNTDGFIRSDSRVNGFYTRAVRDTVIAEFKTRSENTEFGNWIIGNVKKESLPANLRDGKEYFKALLRYYVEDCNRVWIWFLQTVMYDGQRFANDPSGIRMNLETLSSRGADSYMLALMDSVASQNHFTTLKEPKGGNFITNTWDKVVGNSVADVTIDQSFNVTMNAIKALGQKAPWGKGGLNELLGEYFNVAKAIEQVQANPAAGTNSIGQAVIKGKAVAQRATAGFDTNLSQRLLTGLFWPPFDAAGNSAMGIIAPTIIDGGAAAGGAAAGGAAAGGAAAAGGGSGALGAINPLDAAREMMSLYPFNSGSNTDVSVEDFAAVFKPGGSLDQYFDSKKDILSNPQLANTADGQKLVSFRNAVAEIQRSFFPSGNFSTSFDIVADRPEPSGVVAEVDLKLDATKHTNRTSEGMSYEMAKRVTLPGDGSEAFLATRDVSGGAEDKVSAARGPWAAFRLLEKGGLKSNGNGEFGVAWRVNLNGKNVTLRYTIQTSGAKSPLGGLGLLHSLKIPN